MDIGQRLRQIRKTKGLSQGDIEKQVGLLRCYVSRVECGHTIPNLGTLEKWAKALDTPLYELFLIDTVSPRERPAERVDPKHQQFFYLLRKMDKSDRQMFLFAAKQLAKRRRA